MKQLQSLGVQTHSFNVSLAEQVGLAEAIILQHFYFWHRANVDKPDMTKDGRVWFFRSVKSICDDFGYLTPSKVKTAIEKLVSEGWILKGDYNTDRMKRVAWYSLTDYTLSLFTGTPIGENRQCNNDFSVKNSENSNTIGENDTTIGDFSQCKDNSKEDSKQSTTVEEKKKDNNKLLSKKETKNDQLDMSIVPPALVDVVKEWLEYKKERRETYKPKGFKVLVRDIVEYSQGDPNIAQRIIEQSMRCNYAGIFSLKDNANNNNYDTGMIINGDRNELYEADKKNLW